MPESQSVWGRGKSDDLLVLGVDTCGPSGSVALARIEDGKARILGQKELAGRTYSSVLVARVAAILREFGLKLADLGAIVVVNGPGSFTGVRVGTSAVKGLAEPAEIPVVSVSRLAVLAAKAETSSAALDAHRHEVFLRLSEPSPRELVAGAEELATLRQSEAEQTPSQHSGSRLGTSGIPFAGRFVVVCDDAAESLLKMAWPEVNVMRTEPPTAADAIELSVPRVLARDFADLALLDGHYLRRSDAEIFGDPLRTASAPAEQISVRRMQAEDLDRVMAMAEATRHAPAWPREVYERALNTDAQPRRVALVAEEAHSGALVGYTVASLMPTDAAMAPEAELETIVSSPAHQRRGVARNLFSSLKSELQSLGAREVILEVREGNKAARHFYCFLGFAEEGRRAAYYADPAEDAILMRLLIS